VSLLSHLPFSPLQSEVAFDSIFHPVLCSHQVFHQHQWEYYTDCITMSSYNNGYNNGYYSTWGAYGRWIALVAILFAAFFLFFLFA